MLELFRRNLFINNVLLLPYIFILRLSTLLQPAAFQTDANTNILQNIIYQAIPSGLVQNIVANILIFFHALMINYIFINHRMSREITLFSGVFYVLLVTINIDNSLLSNVLIANSFIILALFNLLKSYKVPHPTANIFNTGFWIGLAGLFYSPYFLFIIFGLISLLVFRSFRITEKLQYFTGCAIPYFLLFTYRYWYGIEFIELNFLKDMFFRIPQLSMDGMIIFYIAVGLILFFVIFVLINYGNFVSKKSIQTQKKIDIVYWLLLSSLISFLVFKSENVSHLMTLALPLSILIGIYASDTKKKVFNELVHIIIVALIYISHFYLINI